MYALRYVVGVDYHSNRRVREKVGEGGRWTFALFMITK